MPKDEKATVKEVEGSGTVYPDYPNKHGTGISCLNCEWFERVGQQPQEPQAQQYGVMYPGHCRAGHPQNAPMISIKKTNPPNEYYETNFHATQWDSLLFDGAKYWCRFWTRALNVAGAPVGPP